jgi:hypothetical protein
MNNEIKTNFNELFNNKAQIIIDKVIRNNTNKLFYIKKVLTAGHGYYVIEETHNLFQLAKTYCLTNNLKTFNDNYCFLEEDNEIYDFLNNIK